MGHAQDAKKDLKKKPTLSLKEKRAKKNEKKAKQKYNSYIVGWLGQSNRFVKPAIFISTLNTAINTVNVNTSLRMVLVVQNACAQKTRYIVTYNLRHFNSVRGFNVKAIKPLDFLKTLEE